MYVLRPTQPPTPSLMSRSLRTVHEGLVWVIEAVVCLLVAPIGFNVAAPQSGTHSHLVFATLPLAILSVAFLKLIASSRPSAT